MSSCGFPPRESVGWVVLCRCIVYWLFLFVVVSVVDVGMGSEAVARRGKCTPAAPPQPGTTALTTSFPRNWNRTDTQC